MGCGDNRPGYPAKRYVDCELDHPVGLSVVDIRLIVDEIDQRVQALLGELVA
jgi:hypothetical protein